MQKYYRYILNALGRNKANNLKGKYSMNSKSLQISKNNQKN